MELRFSLLRSLLRCVLLSTPVFALVLIAGPAVAQDEEFADLSLEDMLELELDAVSIAGIHHTHDAGEWMVGFSYMNMAMNGMRNGTNRVSTSDVTDPAQFNFRVSPVKMDMHMLMFHLMYAPSDKITLMGMMPYVRKSMKHVTRMGANFTTRAEGAGDLKLAALYSAYRTESQRVITEFGLSLPSGSIVEKDNNPMSMGADVRLPYPMQLGSGTVDFLPGVTYIGQTTSWQWGGHVKGTVRVGKNANGYRLGNRYKLTSWVSRTFTDMLSGSVRLDWNQWFNIQGRDPRQDGAVMGPMAPVVPTAFTNLQAGKRLDLLVGVTLYEPAGALRGHLLSLEAGLPIYQYIDGPQLETDWMLSLSWYWTI